MLEKMQEKIALLENHEQIVSISNRLFDIIVENRDLPDNEKILVVDLLNAMLNNELYKS
jgi:hypothetical protein